jgi:hypothetical protein
LAHSGDNDTEKMNNTLAAFEAQCDECDCPCFEQLQETLTELHANGHATTITFGGDSVLRESRKAIDMLRLHDRHKDHVRGNKLKSVLWDLNKLPSILLPLISTSDEGEQKSYGLTHAQTAKNYRAINYKLKRNAGSTPWVKQVEHVYEYAQEGIGSLDFALAWARVSSKLKDQHEVKSADEWKAHRLGLGEITIQGNRKRDRAKKAVLRTIQKKRTTRTKHEEEA